MGSRRARRERAPLASRSRSSAERRFVSSKRRAPPSSPVKPPIVVTEREASRTCRTPLSYSGSIRAAVCAAEVVAPPMSSGVSNPRRFISRATPTISSKDGVISPLKPITSAPSSRAASSIVCDGTMTPRSTTS